MINKINPSYVVMKGTDYVDSLIAQVADVGEHLIGCRVAKMVKMPAMSQVPLLVRAPATGLQVVEIHANLMRRGLAMVVRGLCNLTANRSFSLLVANWLKKAITLPKNMPISQCIASLDVLWPMAAHSDSVHMTQLWKKLRPGRSTWRDITQWPNKTPPKRNCTGPNKFSSMRGMVNKSRRFQKMMEKYKYIWYGHFEKISVAKQHIIVSTMDAVTFCTAVYRVGSRQPVLEEEEVDRMVITGLAEPATTEWTFPSGFVHTKDKCFRFCVEYRCLNAVKENNSYSIDKLDKWIDSLGEARVFSTLDDN